MKISFLLLSIERSGGVRGAIEIANHMVDEGHTCRLVTVDDKRIPFELNPSVEIVRAKRRNHKSRISRIMQVYDLAKAIPKDSQLIIASYYLTSYAAIIAKIMQPKYKLIYIIRGYEPNYFRQYNSKTLWLPYALARISYYLPLSHIAVSSWLSELLDQKGCSSISVINNGIDSTFFSPNVIDDEIGRNTILTIAHERLNRGYFDFCLAINNLWKKRGDFEVMVIGTDPQLAKVLQVPCKFIKIKNDDEMVEAYRKALIYVSCSHEEGFGRTPLEAMSCGTAVVCTDSGGVRDYAKNSFNCLIVPPQDLHAIEKAVELLLDNSLLRNKLIKNGRKTAIEFDNAVICKKYHNYFTHR